jgi:predicted DNA-binding transcriptional regulator AlpA
MTARKDDRLLTPAEVAEFLRTTTDVLKTWRYRGDGPPFVKVGRSVLYRWSALDRWLDSRAVAS